RVHNRRAGHNLPTSLTAVREMWLEVLITDENGKELIKSGYLDENGELDGNTHVFNSEGMDMHQTFQIDPWKVVSFAKNGLIPPKGYRDIMYTILYPPGKGHKLNIHAKLRFRQASQYIGEKLLTNLPEGVDLTEWYGLTEIPAVPVVDMTEQNVTIETAGEPTKLPTVEYKLKKASSHSNKIEGSLYEKIGGKLAIDKTVDLLYKRILADDRLSGFFAGVNMVRQLSMQKAFLTGVTGGPSIFTGRSLAAVHDRLGLTDEHYDIFLKHLDATLKEIGVSAELVQEAVDVANNFRDDILGRSLSAKMWKKMNSLKKEEVENTQPAVGGTLYDQLGGKRAIEELSDRYHRKIMADDRVNSFYKGLSMTHQVEVQKEFLIMVTGGPSVYRGSSLKEVHARLGKDGLSASHFDIIIGHFKASLKEIGASDELIQKGVDLAESFRDDVISK
ncbi:MAG: group 1 truncated hemoglobin, partial [Candidatus Electrothrix sp.]